MSSSIARRHGLVAFVGTLVLLASAGCSRDGAGPGGRGVEWTPAELATIASLRLSTLGPPPPDPSNRVADDPAAARLGHALYFDEGLSATGTVSCATCHRPDRKLADDRDRSRGIGVTKRNAPTVMAAAWSPWQFWDGRRDSLWAQALGPLENAGEHGLTRTQVVRHVLLEHHAEYEAAFGDAPTLVDRRRVPQEASPIGSPEQRAAWEALPEEDRRAIDEIFANVGKAIAAHERTLRLAPSRFDLWAEAVVAGRVPAPDATLSADEQAGLRLFIGSAKCTQCHFGPLLSSHEFHNTGVPPAPGEGLEPGRAEGVVEMLKDPFNCLGPHSDASPEECNELRFVKTAGTELVGAVKVPTLRNVAETAPYMHDGSVPDLRGVIEHYVAAPQPIAGHSDLTPLDLSPAEIAQLESFLRTLSSDILPEEAGAPRQAPGSAALLSGVAGLGR